VREPDCSTSSRMYRRVESRQSATGYRSSRWYVRGASPSFARYPGGMAKARVRKPHGQKRKAPADDAIVWDDESTLPPKKPPKPSVNGGTFCQFE
jgi:hypothetical protein